jgi:probable rRNA maturation factor
MPRLKVSITDGRGRPVRVRGLASWLAQASPVSARGAVAVALVGDRTIRTLNQRFRGVDTATDVLSFPAQNGRQRILARGRGARRAAREPEALGDLAIATGVAGRQAREHGHPLGTELRVLALHGLLHLLGYDHHTDRGEMRRAEERLRRRAGLAAGLIARSRRGGRRR